MKKILKYSFACLFLLTAAGCNKLEDFGNTNVNPSAVNDANASALLTNALQGLQARAFETRPGYYTQYFSETQYPDQSLYSIPQVSFAGIYSGNLYDMQNILTLETASNNQKQVAKIVQQYIFWTMTDRWGDIPYSQALKGITVIAPVYDKQEDIYKGMLSTLTASVAALDGGSVGGDIAYGGDASAWKRVGNSLRMLMSIQLSKKYPGAADYAATQFKAALTDAGGYIATNAQNLQLTADGSNYQNPYFSAYNGRNDLGQSATMTDITNGTGDARQNAFGGSSEQKGQNASSNIGVPYGVNRTIVTAFTDANPGWARVLRGDLRTDVPAKPSYIITASEVTLARAEAANLGWTTETLATVYNQGIALSFEQWGVGAPSAAYLAQPDVALTGGTANVKNIAVQRWLASYPDGLQGWNIWRKSGYPVLTPAPNATSTKKQIIRRYVYGTDERTSNLANLNAAIARIPGGVDEGEARVWWDQ